MHPGCPLACHRAHRFGGGEGKERRVRRRFVWRQLGSSCTSGGAGTESGHGSSGSGRLARGVVPLGVGVCSLDWQVGPVGCHVAVGGVARVTVREFPRDACHGVALGSLCLGACAVVCWDLVGSVDQKPHGKCKTVYSHVAVRKSHSGVAQSYGFGG